MIKQGRPLETPKKTLLKFLAGVSTLIATVVTDLEFWSDGDNSVNRSAMDALRYSIKY